MQEEADACIKLMGENFTRLVKVAQKLKEKDKSVNLITNKLEKVKMVDEGTI